MTKTTPLKHVPRPPFWILFSTSIGLLLLLANATPTLYNAAGALIGIPPQPIPYQVNPESIWMATLLAELILFISYRGQSIEHPGLLPETQAEPP